jgi:hypothetical protein
LHESNPVSGLATGADNYVQTYQKANARYDALKATAEQKAREAADAAARGVSRAAWMMLVILVFGAPLYRIHGELRPCEPAAMPWVSPEWFSRIRG